MKKRFLHAVQNCINHEKPEPFESLEYDSLIKKAKSLLNPAIQAEKSIPKWWQYKRLTFSGLEEKVCPRNCKKIHGPDTFWCDLVFFSISVVVFSFCIAAGLANQVFPLVVGVVVGIISSLAFLQITMFMRLNRLRNIVRDHYKDLTEKAPKTEAACIAEYEKNLVLSCQNTLIGEDSAIQKLDRELSQLLQTAESFHARFSVRMDTTEEQGGEIPSYLKENAEDNLKLIDSLKEAQTELRRHIGVIRGFFEECHEQLRHLDGPLGDLGLVEEYAQFKEEAAVKPVEVKNAIVVSSATLATTLTHLEREFSKLTSHPPVPSLPERSSSRDFQAIEEVVGQYLNISIPKVPDLSPH